MEPWVNALLIAAVVLVLRERGYAWPVTLAAVSALVALSLLLAMLLALLLPTLV